MSDMTEIKRSKSSDEIKRPFDNPFHNKRRFHFSNKNAINENFRTFGSSESSTTFCKPDDGLFLDINSNNCEKIAGANNGEAFFKPVDFNFLTTSEKKSFHYDLKIFEATQEDSNSSDHIENNKSINYSHLRRKDSICEKNQLNLGIDPFSTCFRGMTLEASYENSLMQSENVGEIKVPNKKSFHFINKFAKKEAEVNEKMMCITDFVVDNNEEIKVIDDLGKKKDKNLCIEDLVDNKLDKLALATSITEFGENDFLGKRSTKSFYDSLSLEIPDECLKCTSVKNPHNFESFQQNPILSCSPTKKNPLHQKVPSKDEKIVSFNAEIGKILAQEHESRIYEEKFQQPCISLRSKFHLELEESAKKRDFEGQLFNDDDVKELFQRTKTPEFAKILQNLGKGAMFFKDSKIPPENKKNAIRVQNSQESKIMDSNEFSEKKNQNFHGNLQNQPILAQNENDDESSIRESIENVVFQEETPLGSEGKFVRENLQKNRQTYEIESILESNLSSYRTKKDFNKKQVDSFEDVSEGKSSKFQRAFSLNLMKYKEMEKVLREITKEKEKLGKSLQKLMQLHKNEIGLNSILKENKEAKFKYQCSSTKGIKNILNRFLEDPKDSDHFKFFKKNYFSGNSQTNALIKQKKKLTLNTPLISELSLNTTININNKSSVYPSNNTSYILSGRKSKPSIKPKEQKNNLIPMAMADKNSKKNVNKAVERNASLGKIKGKKNDLSLNKENNACSMNLIHGEKIIRII